jgi:hypothetical protein
MKREPDDSVGFEGRAKSTLHSPRAFGDGAHQTGSARQTNDDAIRFGEIVTAEYDRVGGH